VPPLHARRGTPFAPPPSPDRSDRFVPVNDVIAVATNQVIHAINAARPNRMPKSAPQLPLRTSDTFGPARVNNLFNPATQNEGGTTHDIKQTPSLSGTSALLLSIDIHMIES
jgi:hypothetical protein